MTHDDDRAEQERDRADLSDLAPDSRADLLILAAEIRRQDRRRAAAPPPKPAPARAQLHLVKKESA